MAFSGRGRQIRVLFGGCDLIGFAKQRGVQVMQRFRLKADGRIVELRDGQEFPLAPDMTTSMASETPPVRDLRRRARLTQQEFAAKVGVPVETIRNWEQGKRMPRGPARALLAVIAHAPDTVFAALSKG
jgi:putative transcriptional regulator